MAGEVLRGETLTARSGQWISLAFVPVTLALAAAPYPIIFREPYEPGGFGYEMATWYVRAFFVVLALMATKAAVGLDDLCQGRSSRSTGMRSIGGPVLARSAPSPVPPVPPVRSTSCSVNYLWFESAVGDRIQEIPIIVFDVRDIRVDGVPVPALLRFDSRD